MFGVIEGSFDIQIESISVLVHESLDVVSDVTGVVSDPEYGGLTSTIKWNCR